MKSTPPLPTSKALLALMLLVAHAGCANAQPTVDAEALAAIGSANQRAAVSLELATCAGERSAVAQAASGCTDTVCRVSIAAIAALTPCAAMRGAVAAAAAPPPAPQIINAAPPPTVGERIAGFFAGTVSKIFDTALAIGPSYLNYRLGSVQSANNMTLAMRQSDNALAAQQSTNQTFAGFGANLRDTATAGFSGLGTLGARPTSITTITGNGNATNGSTVTTTTTTLNCQAHGAPATGAPSGNTGAGPTSGASGDTAPTTSGAATANCVAAPQ